jgi:POT family proton-dependent oligopeptide transporter
MALDLNGKIGKFPRIFWVVCTLEMVERAAYYGMLAALPYHLVYNLHFPTTSVGLILSLLTPFLYILPIISGALAGKYGFRMVMVPAFLVITVGYCIAGISSTFYMMLGAFIILGFGTGSFKPMTSGTIAASTSESTRNLGYSYYYWMINLGSFLAPLAVAIAIPKESYQVVFFMSAALVAANFVLSFLLFKNPIKPDPKKSISEVLKGAVLVLQNRRFLILVVIFAGFWFMYAVNNAAIVLYMVDFKVTPDWFPPALVQVVNPITILVVGLFLGKFIEKYDSLHAMIAGMVIFIAGMLMLGLTTIGPIFIAGIVVFSIAEFIVYPTYLSYISKIAPKDKVAIYMGYGFLPAFIGYTSGNFLVALAYTVFSEEAHRPKFFWALIGSVGLLTIACMMLYSQYLGRQGVVEKSSSQKEAEAPMEGVDMEDRALPDVASAQAGTALRRHPVWESRITVAVALLIIPGLLFGAYAGGTDGYFRNGGGGGGGTWDRYIVTDGGPINSEGYSNANTDTTYQAEINATNLLNVTFTLSWTDEPDTTRFLRTWQNQPDNFGLEVSSSDGANASAPMTPNVHGAEGKVSCTLHFEPKKPGSDAARGPFNVTVKCGACGMSTNRASPIGYTDAGNAWTLEVSYSYYAKK